MFNVQNLRTEAHTDLKKANLEWNECISKNFLPQWLKGESLSIEEACPNENAKRMELNEAVYGESPLPFKHHGLEWSDLIDFSSWWDTKSSRQYLNSKF